MESWQLQASSPHPVLHTGQKSCLIALATIVTKKTSINLY